MKRRKVVAAGEFIREKVAVEEWRLFLLPKHAFPLQEGTGVRGAEKNEDA